MPRRHVRYGEKRRQINHLLDKTRGSPSLSQGWVPCTSRISHLYLYPFIANQWEGDLPDAVCSPGLRAQAGSHKVGGTRSAVSLAEPTGTRPLRNRPDEPKERDGT